MALTKKNIPQPIFQALKQCFHFFSLVLWFLRGRPVPPPHYIKQLTIRKYQKKFGIDILVETGTLFGDMVYALRKKFQKIYSIELDPDLYQRAAQRFLGQDRISIIQGDSGRVLFDLLPRIKAPAIFWLDGHYSGGHTACGDKKCPILEELTAILSSEINHVLLIDDARCFGTSGDFPSISELSEFILSRKRQSRIEVKDDIIRVIIL